MLNDRYTGRLHYHRYDFIMSRKKLVAHRHSRSDAAQGSRARKQCEALGARLAAVGAELLAWDEAHEEATEVYRTSLLPLDESVRRRLRELVLLLDRMHPSAELDNRKREILSGILADMASDLLDADEEGEVFDDELDEKSDAGEENVVGYDPELAAIYERHRGGDLDPMTAPGQRVDQVHGIDLGTDIDLESSETSKSLHAMVAKAAETELAQLARAQDKFEQLAAQQRANLAHLQQAEDELVMELKTALHGAQAMDEAAGSSICGA
ncbi:MAG: hypothetical protein AB1437_16240 [Pseudomonadota bacterium]